MAPTRRLPSLRLVAFSVAVTFALPTGSGASAQDAGVDLDSLAPAPSVSTDGWTTLSSAPRSHLSWEAGTAFGYADRLLVETTPGGEENVLLGGRASLHLLGDIGLFDQFALGLAVPLHLAQSTSAPSSIPGLGEPEDDFALGDVRLVPRALIWSGTGDGFVAGLGVGFAPVLVLPTGNDAAYQGGDFELEPRLIVDWAAPQREFFAALNVGYALRGAGDIGGHAVDDAIPVELSCGAGLVEGVDAELEVVSRVATGGAGAVSHFDLLAGVRWQPLDGLTARLALGRGLDDEIGSPSFRALAAASWSWTHDTDRDDDGVLNAVDSCRDVTEDLDGHDDDDGCPDTDDDGDGIPDATDECDDQAEDADGHMDADGCIDPDNDGDGVPDEADNCDDEPEDIDGFEDADGCAEGDNDGDTVDDTLDACRFEDEDFDGFQDEDGCPDPDNDGDLVPDDEDQCDDAEEVVNGVSDDDGCPDSAPIEVLYDAQRIALFDPITFGLRRTAFDPSSAPVLDALATALSAHPGLRIRVVGFAMDEARENHRQPTALARATAVRDALIARGVDASRVDVEGSADAAPATPPDPSAPGSALPTIEIRIR